MRSIAYRRNRLVNKTVQIETYTSTFWWKKNFYRTDRDLNRTSAAADESLRVDQI